MRIKIKKDDINKRLDVFLSEKYGDVSRSQWQKRIRTGEVLVNDMGKAVHYFLKENDVVEIKRIETKQEKQSVRFDNVKIIKEEKDYLIINKPAGMVVHEDNVNKGNTLVDWLVKKYLEIKEVGDSEIRPGIVHRLDKDVSGVMVVAKNQKTFDLLKKQFKSRKIFKEYMALVHNMMEPDEGEINLPIKRSASKGIFVADTQKESDGRSAITKYEVMKKFRNYTLLKIRILTGRTHQIRVHMRSLGHPVVGDKLYITRDMKRKKLVDLDRLWLFASKLGFKDIDGISQEFGCEMPLELKDFLNKIK